MDEAFKFLLETLNRFRPEGLSGELPTKAVNILTGLSLADSNPQLGVDFQASSS